MQKKTSYLIFIIIGILLALYYLGILGEVKITEKDIGPFKVVYQTHIGDYSNVINLDKEISSTLTYYNISSQQSFGIYYDNPDTTPTEQLRSEIGLILTDNDYNTLTNLKTDYNLKIIPKSKNIVIEFPYRGSISILIGLYKVYPKLEEYIQNNNYLNSPIMEIYDTQNQKIIYSMEI